jgi:hypothetical protein
MDKSKKEEMKQLIKVFQEDFYNKFAIVPVVHYKVNGKLPALSLQQIDLTVDKFVNKHDFPNGIRTKSRKREVVIPRYCAFKLAIDNGFTLERIGLYFGNFDHSTVLHAKKTINNLITICDKKVLDIWNEIENYILINYNIEDEQEDKLNGNDGDVQSHNTEGDNP